MTKRRLFVLTAIAVLILTACAAETEGPAEDVSAEPIKIGFVSDFSGEWAANEVPARDGAQFAVDEINEAGGVLGRPLELIARDGKDDNALTMRLVEELIDDGVVYIIGTVGDPLVATGKVACEKGIPISTGIGSADTLIMDIGECGFQPMMADTTQGAVAAQYAYEELGARTAYTLLSNEFPYVQDLPEYFKQTFEHLGGEVIGTDEFRHTGGDYSAQATTIAGLDPQPDVIYTSMICPDTNIFVRQLRAAGIDTPVMGPDGFDNPVLLDAGEAMEGVYFTTSGMPSPGSPIEDFYNKFEEATGKRPDCSMYIIGYDEIYVIKHALESAGSAEPGDVMEALRTLKGFEGLLGSWDMGPDRRAKKSIAVVKVEDNEFQLQETLYPDWKPEP